MHGLLEFYLLRIFLNKIIHCFELSLLSQNRNSKNFYCILKNYKNKIMLLNVGFWGNSIYKICLVYSAAKEKNGIYSAMGFWYEKEPSFKSHRANNFLFHQTANNVVLHQFPRKCWYWKEVSRKNKIGLTLVYIILLINFFFKIYFKIVCKYFWCKNILWDYPSIFSGWNSK